ncbi:hypothetical protein GTZ99_12160 [Novosphingobium sp. FSY-8]|uniref:Uncharacterized protein n=1 Tax=Novosphingobium ovatum TaxID=1908523 RepID=A0ABW9XFN4_9SPHN|nr:hypothetical protein [Novosphingobium ovatum]NBC37309.1 hypothetical protein [Novosphingobium ovatum]
MTGKYWFRGVPGRPSKYVPTCWQGVAVLVAAPVIMVGVTATVARLWSPVAGLIAFPFVLFGGLVWLFVFIARHSEP